MLDPVVVVPAAPERDLDGPERPAVARGRGAAGAVQDPGRAAGDQDAAAGPAVLPGVLDEADLEAGVGEDQPHDAARVSGAVLGAPPEGDGSYGIRLIGLGWRLPGGEAEAWRRWRWRVT